MRIILLLVLWDFFCTVVKDLHTCPPTDFKSWIKQHVHVTHNKLFAQAEKCNKCRQSTVFQSKVYLPTKVDNPQPAVKGKSGPRMWSVRWNQKNVIHPAHHLSPVSVPAHSSSAIIVVMWAGEGVGGIVLSSVIPVCIPLSPTHSSTPTPQLYGGRKYLQWFQRSHSPPTLHAFSEQTEWS